MNMHKQRILSWRLANMKLWVLTKASTIQQIIRSEFIGILSTIVANFEGTPLSDMKILLSEDPEVDFFENIKHIQVFWWFSYTPTFDV